MKRTLCLRIFWLVLIVAIAGTAWADIRMQPISAGVSIYSRPSPDAQRLGSANMGEILFVSRMEGDWAALSPPDRIGLWLNKDFVEGNRVVARSIQLRAGPGIQYDVVGSLERGAPVMPRGEEGEWCQIGPPSSATVWMKKADLKEVQMAPRPVQEVAAVLPAPEPAPEPKPEPKPAPKPEPRPEPKPEPRPQPKPRAQPAPQPAPAETVAHVPSTTPPPPQTVKVAPSVPQSRSPSAPKPAARVEPTGSPMIGGASPARPVVEPAQTAARTRPAQPAATSSPGRAPRPTTAPPPRATTPRPMQAPARPAPAPAPASAVTAQKTPALEVTVSQELVADLDLDETIPNQGRPVQVEGEIRNAPFLTASPSRYRLLNTKTRGLVEMVCHLHGHSAQLRQYIGKEVSIRGREYWVDNSDMPVVVVGQIVPLFTSPADEPVLF